MQCITRMAQGSLLLLAGGIGACTDVPVPTTPDAIGPPSSASRGIGQLGTQGHGQRRFEARFGAASRDLPGFGGYEFDDAGNMHVFLMDTAHAQRARGYLASHEARWRRSAHRQGGTERRIIIHQAQFEIAQLHQWHELLTDNVLSMRGAVFTDLDERRNRIAIGLLPATYDATKAAVQRELDALAVPRAAVTFTGDVTLAMDSCDGTEVICDPKLPSPDPGTEAPADSVAEPTPDPSYAEAAASYSMQYDDPSVDYFSEPDPSFSETVAAECTTLSSRCRPVLAGTRIQYAVRQPNTGTIAYPDCTLGFPARLSNWRRTFVTASHCSGYAGITQGTGYYQPVVAANGYIGAEYSDPAFNMMQWDPAFGTNLRAKYSDALAAVWASVT